MPMGTDTFIVMLRDADGRVTLQHSRTESEAHQLANEALARGSYVEAAVFPARHFPPRSVVVTKNASGCAPS
jgi:hypothetical protein